MHPLPDLDPSVDLDEPTERLLVTGDLVVVPADFAARVMNALEAALATQPARPARSGAVLHFLQSSRDTMLMGLRWLALSAGGVLGFVQLVSFLFGMWTASAVA